MTVAFDTLTYARKLREVGVPQEQAEAHAAALAAAVGETLATKDDLREIAASTKQDLQELASASRRDLQELRQEFHELASSTKQQLREHALATEHQLREHALATKQDLRELELGLTVRLGGMAGVSVAAVAALVRLL